MLVLRLVITRNDIVYPERERHPSYYVILRLIQRGNESENLLPTHQNAGVPAYNIDAKNATILLLRIAVLAVVPLCRDTGLCWV